MSVNISESYNQRYFYLCKPMVSHVSQKTLLIIEEINLHTQRHHIMKNARKSVGTAPVKKTYFILILIFYIFGIWCKTTRL